MGDLPKDQAKRAPWVISADTSDELRARYDQWAETYDSDLEDVDAYAAPQMVAEKLSEFAVPDGAVLDVACGTGLCGKAYHAAGFENLTGIDYSQNMLALAGKRGVYRDLQQADLNDPLAFDDNTFHAVTVVGLSLHFPPAAYHEFARVLSPGGLIFYCGDETSFEERGMRALCEAYVAAGKWVDVEETASFKPLPVSEPGLDYRIFIHQVIDK
ncbi:MAG: class I SAM-dependent methyltransferase [Pseudomonadota bacterium]